ncbi:hypothetical protein JNB_14438 [Janibacter sp. HTCC2649]|uniref:hypothetical protein n=1 Tax=Janibacter sp. HTCC2649 TaxID=313589 RepID=UPI00006719BD|nr:hypothetical protein [Janibacter sp. HTCC2649]EAP98170.1 hypothetical protein JNB_14438 [Janibacter sp. HTCC2649]
MPRTRTRASRWAAVATWLLALVLLGQALRAESTGAIVLEGSVAAAAALGATKMWIHNCFESHLVVVLAVGATLIGSVLSLTLGMPGGPVTPLTPFHVVVLALGIAIGTLLFADARARRPSG